ncbi:MAG: hypothetical protein OXN94_07975 [Chloroflexota bacterium]|nr:hypothetical protein [Chloroflexota bacterium]
MRFVLYSLCVLIILLASFLFVLGYDGTQIREFLLGIAAIVVVASRIIGPRRANNDDKETVDQGEAQREERLRIANDAPEQVAEPRESSERNQTR